MFIGLDNIFQKSRRVSRSISAENQSGDKGRGGMAIPAAGSHARELGQGWKVCPYYPVKAMDTVTIMDVNGPGVIRHIFITFDEKFNRDVIIRIYWDKSPLPSVECPIGDFMCNSWNKRQNILAIPVNVNPTGAMNMFFPMPFREHAKITIENDSVNELPIFAYTINYNLEDVPDDSLYFHAFWNRTNPIPYGTDYMILDNVRGKGQFVGLFMAWQQNNAGWWGEGEIKMYLDGDREFPTICGTGTEDYFGGAWCFGEDYSAPFFGYRQVTGKSRDPGTRMTLYRFHICDPVYFETDLKITMQALGWRSERRYLPLQDDVSSVAYWYQTLPCSPFQKLPDRNAREII